ncbi:glycosyltransferase family 2 protein [Flavobacterium circumlabens]|uniref:GT2 family glycosyltransferase n=1 Tax=Flavobacterium circumlabens TaxID=2133765 RepID=A0A4Y7UAV9_9FLAO|nr:glycosyltransferase family 2 protein [Flavobacterium circumlabens]TCN56390.1 GT2 family glycosyltransferase [Flavobacterium circumlabens]TEB43424.1 glycosyltransferase family 2 protein [Flavobacterium circumlabens]
MKTSVVIVTFNGMKWIENCLESILGNTELPEIIIVDNCSSDNTVEFLKNTYFQKIKLIESKENLGFGRANNLGIAKAFELNSDFIFLLNQDTVIEKDTIEKLLAISLKNPDYGIISPIHSNGDNSSLDLSFLYYINQQCSALISDFVLDKKRKELYPVEMINAAAWFLPVKTFEIVGGFDPLFFLYGEDDNFCQRVLYHNLKIGITTATIIKHDSGNNFKVDFPKGSKNYYNKFLNRIKVKFANVNSEDFRKINTLKRHFLKEALLSLLKFKFDEFTIYKTKYKLIDKKSLEASVLKNRQTGKKYLV